jgi:hypothetical protein
VRIEYYNQMEKQDNEIEKQLTDEEKEKLREK